MEYVYYCVRVVNSSFLYLELLHSPDEECVDGYVGEKDYGCRHPCSVESVVDGAYSREEYEDDGKRLVHVETEVHDTMVDVCLVRVKHVLAVELALDGYSYHIYARKEDQGVGYEEGFLTVGESALLVVHLILYGEISDDVAKEE